MRCIKGVLVLAAAALIFAAPAWASAHAGKACGMHPGHAAANAHAGHDPRPQDGEPSDDSTVEEIPETAFAPSSDGGARCSHVKTARAEQCDMKMPRCNMTGGCCIKGAGPLSTGAKDRAAGQDENINLLKARFLGIDGRSAYLPNGDFKKVELTFPPVPRPPSA